MHRLSEELSQIKNLLRTNPQGMSITEIASSLGRNKHSVGRYLDILHASGYVDLRTFGMAKVYTLSSRVSLQALLSYTSDLVLVLDRDMRVIQANEPFFYLLKLDKNQILYNRLDLVPAPEPFIHELLIAILDQIQSSDEHRDLKIDSDPSRYFRVKTIPTVFEDGTNGWTIILEDTTAEQKALQSVRESEEFFRSVSDHLTDGLIVTEGKSLIFMNDRFSEITGYTKENVELLDPMMLPVPQERERFRRALEECEQDCGKIKEIRFWAYRRDNTEVYLYIRVSQVPFGNRIRRYILFTDMTRWKLQEESQNLQSTLMSRLMDNFSHPLYIIDGEGVFFMANDSFCRLIAFDGETVKGKHASEVLPKDLVEPFLQGDQKLVLNKNYFHTHNKINFLRADGTPGEVWIEKSVVSAGDDLPSYIFGVVIDKSECQKFVD